MIIEKRWLVKFYNVMPGQVFEYNGIIYIRIFAIITLDTDGLPEKLCNAIDLSNGEINVFDDDEEVTVYDNAKVVLI